jgi:hypothetical protein
MNLKSLKGVVVVYFKALSQHLPGHTEKNDEPVCSSALGKKLIADLDKVYKDVMLVVYF